MNKKRVYFNEYNVLMEGMAYLPIVSGLLRAFAETDATIIDNYQFMDFFYYRDDIDKILFQYDDPAIACFSVSMWNEQFNLRVARAVKERFPKCTIVFGGPQVPHHPHDYFETYPFIDLAVRGEGENTFSEILLRHLESDRFETIPGLAWRHARTGECIRNEEDRKQPKDLDMYPSPYLEGLYGHIMKDGKLRYQAIIETNRGCPFPCSFCFWGQGGLSFRYRFHTIERVAKEIEWCAQNGISYIFNADSNFGMHKRDKEIAAELIRIKKEYGYPEKFRTCFGKNTDDRIFEIAEMLHGADLEKGIGAAKQRFDRS